MRTFWVNFIVTDTAPTEPIEHRFYSKCGGFGQPFNICCLVQADTPLEAQKKVCRYYPDAEEFSFTQKPESWRPGDRFPGLVPL